MHLAHALGSGRGRYGRGGGTARLCQIRCSVISFPCFCCVYVR